MSRSPELTEPEKYAIVARYNFYTNHETGSVTKGVLDLVANDLKLKKRSVSRIMTQYRKLVTLKGNLIVDMKPLKSGRVGRKSKLNEVLKRKIIRKNTATKGSLSIRGLAEEVLISKSCLQRYLISMNATLKTMWIRPKLTYHQRMDRLRFIMNLRSGPRSWTFREQFDTIVVDESWFYLHRTKGFVRLFPGDPMPEPVRVQHKSHIPKIMFLSALARPQPDRGFDGRIGMWRVNEERICKRTSRYHQKDDVYMHDCTMTAIIYRGFMMQIFQQIKRKMPWLRGQPVFVQQDGAAPHTGKGNMDYFDIHGRKNGWNIKVITQPAQSPDLNINDLGFFRSIKCQVEQIKKGANSLDSLFDAVSEAWETYSPDTLRNIWAQQYACYHKILEDKGNNSYTPPHTGVRNSLGLPDLQINREHFREARALVIAEDGH
jgi:hypothetical protein